MLVSACARRRQISFGPFGINEVWAPQSAGCDAIMTGFCNRPVGLLTEPERDICACFIQQTALDQQFRQTKVPVMCFGTDARGDMSKNCAFNASSYKTFDMLQNSCSFAECQQAIQPGTNAGNIQCQGTFTQFKIPEDLVDVSVSVSATADDDVLTSYQTFIPKWLWVAFGSAIAMLLSFLVSLTFVA